MSFGGYWTGVLVGRVFTTFVFDEADLVVESFWSFVKKRLFSPYRSVFLL